ncbi:MAG: nickel-dependent lactate racemase [Candidatus Altiarchaeota archaeon]|nr:nickel-dependent lactate racemase [Candidatus Altiarchaeota archaeon]
MRIKLPYGGKKLPLDVPDENLLGVLKPKGVRVDKSPRKIIEDALDNPVGTEKLAEIIAKKEKKHKVAIVVDDHTRPCPTAEMLPPLLDELYDLGIGDDNILIIFATGSHRTTKKEEAEILLGKGIASRIEYISNDCNGSDFVYVGTTSRGTRVEVKKPFLEADVRILTGDVEIHYFAGYGGGRKSILPGISSYSTIQDNYKRNFFHHNSRPGRLDGNPMYENMTEAARLAGIDFTINVVQDEKGIVGAFAGDFDSVLRRGAALVEKIYKAETPKKADIVVTAANGAPHDIDLYQAYKALHLSLGVVRDKGVVILVAECPEGAGNGVGHRNYAAWMRKYGSGDEMKTELEKEFNIGGHKAYYNHLAREKATLFLVSEMPKAEVEGVFLFKYAETPQEALEKAINLIGKDAKVLVIPEGSTTLTGVKEK